MYKDIETLIENTVTKERYNESGEKVNYIISPADGYLLHEKSRDEAIFDGNGIATGEIKKGYTSGIVTVLANYDFEKNEREIYAIEADNIRPN